MSSWTPEQHADARVWANERGAKSRALAGALDEIERLQAENAKSFLSLGEVSFDPEPFIDGEDDRNSDMKWFMDGQWRKDTDV